MENNSSDKFPPVEKDHVFDCAIAGGGLAGLTLAVQLAEAGYSVILFEKEKYPFHKVCGEYISMESFDFLERIGIPISNMNLPMINEVLISAPNGNTLSRKLDLGGFGISRFTLDAKLAELAIKKGVVLKEETKVIDIHFDHDLFSVKTSQHYYKAKTVCGAFGKHSLLDKKLGRYNSIPDKNYLAVKYHVKLDCQENLVQLHNFKDGYCGISKVDGDKYCMCYLSNSQNLRDNGNDIKAMERNVLMKNPFLKKYFNAANFLFEEPLTISQITFNKKTTIQNHVLMLGDAAGNIAPLCGNGMSMAMHSSYIAFQLLKKYFEQTISRQQLEQLYQHQWSNHFSSRINTGRTIQMLFGKESITNFSIALLNKLPMITNKIINSTHGIKF